MIKLNTPSFIYTSEDTQTSSKVSELVVNYTNYLGTKEIDGISTAQGYIQSFVYNETMNSILTNTQEAEAFTGNILNDLTNQYIAKLQALNPSITFTNTL
jgi:outer membrane lipopolysaccharide assembly protein LptE/RlpB